VRRLTARWHRLPRWVRWPLWAGAAAVTAGVGLLVVLWFTLDLPDDDPLPEAAVLLTADGQELAVLAEDGVRFNVELEAVAPVVVDALIAAEDRRFYGHSGIDPVGIARAAWRNSLGGGNGRQGGSTLTQQLVKNLRDPGERNLLTKVREAVLATRLEQTMDKDDIVERYLNTVYFGRGTYGIEAASRSYFGVSALELRPSQAALLVGLLRSPETAEPLEHPEEAARRRQTVLDAMVETGDLTADEAAAAAAEPIEVLPRPDSTRLTAGVAPHFVEWAEAEAIAAVGEAALYRDGLRVVTTLDLEAQQAAEAAIAEILPDPADPQAALIALDTDGSVRAHVGSRDYETVAVDIARGADGGGSGRQPGSTFKPFVLAAALQGGARLADTVSGPATIDLDVGGTPWSVENYGGEGYGELDLVEATADSVNTAYAQLLADVGPQAVVDAAHTLGVTSELQPEPSIALGAEEVSPLELARAYLALADDGRGALPHVIERIEDADGNVVWTPALPEAAQVIDADVSRGVTRALEAVIDGGTGTAADIDRPAAGKTGTTQSNVDAWFAGYVPGYAAVVWMGYPDAALPMDDVHGRAVTGGSFPAQIWQRFMTVAVADRPADDFPAPSDEMLGRSSTTTSSTSSTSSSSTTSTSTVETTTTEAPAVPTTRPPATTTTTDAPAATTTTVAPAEGEAAEPVGP
jgi:membrane peptidoglycan carboxypeptidase